MTKQVRVDRGRLLVDGEAVLGSNISVSVEDMVAYLCKEGLDIEGEVKVMARDDYESLMSIATDWLETDNADEFPTLVEVVKRLNGGE